MNEQETPEYQMMAGLLLVQQMLKAGRYEEALNWAHGTSRLIFDYQHVWNDEHAKHLYFLGNCYDQLSYLGEAEYHYEMALSIYKNYSSGSPDKAYIDCLRSQGFIYAQKTNYQAAIDLLNQALKLSARMTGNHSEEYKAIQKDLLDCQTRLDEIEGIMSGKK